MEEFIIHNGERYQTEPGADFTKKSLYEADLSGRDLREANFSEANVHQSLFNGTNLEKSDFTGASIWGMTATNAKMKGAVFKEAQNVQGVDFQGADLRQSVIGDADFSEVNLTNAITIGSDIDTANHPNAEHILDTTEKLYHHIIEADEVTPIVIGAAIDIAKNPNQYDMSEETHKFFNNVRKTSDLLPLRTTSRYFAGQESNPPLRRMNKEKEEIALEDGLQETINDFVAGEGTSLKRINTIKEQGREERSFLQRLSEETKNEIYQKI